MRWGAKITDTAKLSHKGRWLFLAKVKAMVARLKDIRLRAIRYASLESITALAAQIPLPEESAAEHVELWGHISPIDAHKASTLSHSLSGDDEWGGHRATYGTVTDTPPPKDHVILASWGETYPGKLEQYLDYLDRTSPGSRPALSFRHLSGCAGFKLTGTIGQDSSFPISGYHLLRLQQDIDDADKYHKSFSQRICDVKRSFQCSQSRWDMERTDGNDLAFLMKSRGYGSPLVESITADEPWPDDEWERMAEPARRSRLCGNAEATASTDHHPPGYAEKKSSHGSPRQVLW